MIRASDLMPLAPAGPRLPAAPREAAGGTLNPAAWFDGEPVAADTRIGVALDATGRGLSVAQHAERVLGHLCACVPDRS